jgi:hypothetical protein
MPTLEEQILAGREYMIGPLTTHLVEEQEDTTEESDDASTQSNG